MNGARSAVQLLSTLPPRELVRKAASRVRRTIDWRLEARRARYGRSTIADPDLVKVLDPAFDSLEAFLGHMKRRERPILFLPMGEGHWDTLAQTFPQAARETLEMAERICQHQLSQLGLEPVSLGEQIDWHRDYRSGARWSPKTYYKLVEEVLPEPGADVLFPWWLSSFYHLIPLGKAHRYARIGVPGSQPHRDAHEFTAQILAWVRENPYPFGVNWKSTTIVAIRVVHWVWAWYLFKDAESISDRFWAEFFKQILRHARHIRANLEWFPVRTNHYLANLAGLFYIGLLFPEFREAQEWLAFSHGELVREIDHHTSTDGVTHEGSLNYHRFATEIFLATTLLGRANGLAFSEDYIGRLERMLEFLLHTLCPDGTLPRAGDAADIRLQHLDERDVIADPRHLLALGAVLFGRGDLKQAAGPFPEYAFWLAGEEGRRQYERLPGPAATLASKSFAEGGFHILRDERVYLLIRCGRLALDGVAGHGHHDQLSFELWVEGEPLLVDPGWYAYEAHPAMYRHLRATRAHNTVTVDGRNQVARDLFLYPPPARPVPCLLAWKAEAAETVLSGRHALYGDLPDPVVHQRTLCYRAGDRTIWIEDLLDARQVHQLEWNFHFAPGVRLTARDAGVLFTGSRVHGQLSYEGLQGGRVCIEEDWVAPTYGVRLRAPVLRWFWQGQLPACLRSVLQFG